MTAAELEAAIRALYRSTPGPARMPRRARKRYAQHLAMSARHTAAGRPAEAEMRRAAARALRTEWSS